MIKTSQTASTARTSPRRPGSARAMALAAAVVIQLAALGGCESAFERIDRQVDSLLGHTSDDLGSGAPAPRASTLREDRQSSAGRDAYLSDELATVNPASDELEFVPSPQAMEDTDAVMRRLEDYSELPADAIDLSLIDALRYATRESREYRFAEEDYILSALALLIEEHRWGPRFFDDVSAAFGTIGDDHHFDTSLRIINEFRVTQRLPYGGEVSARALASATEDLHRRVAGEHVQSGELLLNARIPLLRGAGYVAREDLIQSRRNLIYAARSFERFRRSFMFEIARDYLDLVVGQRRIANAEASVESFDQLEEREKSLYDAGRATRFAWAEAQNETLDAVDRLNGTRESYRLSVDRFKVRIGIAIDRPTRILPGSLRLPIPIATIDDAVARAMMYRLDLQTRRDQVQDSERALANARNQLLPDLELTGSLSFPTDDERMREGYRLNTEDATYNGGVRMSLPLDRKIERLQVREGQIDLERSRRDQERVRDDIATEVRAAVRGIDSAEFSLAIQEKNYEIAQQREASIKASEDRATIQQKTDAINQTTSARDGRDRAERDLEVAILRYLLDSGQLRVGLDGGLELLAGMELRQVEQREDESVEGEG